MWKYKKQIKQEPEIRPPLTLQEQQERRENFQKENKRYVNEDGKTKTDIMSENINETIEKWISGGCNEIDISEISKLNVKDNIMFKYLKKDGKIIGGGKFLGLFGSEENRYLSIYPFTSRKAFYPLLKDINRAFIKDIKQREIINEKDESALKAIKEIYDKTDKKDKGSYNKFWDHLLKEYDLSGVYKKNIIYFYKTLKDDVKK